MKREPIKYVAEIRSGYQFRGKVEPSDDPNAAVIQIKDLSDRLGTSPGETIEIQLGDLVRVRLDNPAPHFLRPGDVLFLSRGHRQVAAVFTGTETDTIAASYFFVLRPVLQKIHPAFLAWFINQAEFQEKLRPLSYGTHMQLVSIGDFKDLTVVVPPFPVQYAILELQNFVDRERQLSASLQEKRERLVLAVSQQLLSGQRKLKDN